MSDALTSLRQALIDAAGSPFALDAAFLTSGLNDPSVTVPPDYDTWIQQAFFTAAASDFLITIQASNVGEIVDDHFTVTDANVPFVGASAPIASPATLIFALRTEGDNQALVVQIQSRPQDWTWSNSFAFLGGFPFDQLDVADTQFVFSTDDGTYPWFDPKGSQVFGGAKQNLTAQLPFPTIAAPFLALIDGLSAPSGNLLLTGALDLSTYDAETVLMPTGTLSATIQDGAFTLVYLNVSNPSITLTIPPPEAAEPGVPPEESDEGDQAPLLSISSLLAVGDESGPDSPYHIQIDVLESSDGSGQSTESYDVNLVATGEGTPLTPATVVELVGGSGSYLSATPAVLQQFLAFVSLQGLAFSGMLANPASPSLIAVDIGSSPNTSLTIIPDPTGQLDFTIKSFALQWSVSDPFNSQTRRFTYDFTTQFTLATAVFKGPEGEGDGVFEVQFTSDQQYVASFEGSAKLSDFLGTLSGGAVTLEGIVEAELSGIRLSVNVPGQSFTFFSAFSLELPFLTVGGEPVLALREGEVNVAAKTPTQGSGDGRGLQAQQNTVWQSSIGGQFSVGPLFTTARIEYDGFETPARWNLEAALAQPFDVEELINQFFSPGGSYVFPDFLPGNLTILNFGINAMLPAQSGSALATTYDIRTRFNWLFTFGDQSVGIDPANLTLSYRGDKPVNQQFSGSADGRWIYDAIGLELLMGYTFVPTALGNNQTLFVEWEGFRATWRSLENDVTFSLKGWSIGTLIQALVRTLGNPYFTLPSPWSLLNQVSLDGLEVIVSLQSGQAFSQRLSAKYTLSSPIELGFVRITALTFRRDTNGKVTLAITGSSPISDQLGDLMDPNKGQDVNNLPTVPGRGQENFKLFLLAVGQRIGITGSSTFANTKEAICALSNVPSTTGRTNPVDPNADQGSATGLPYYNRDNNWLIAFHLGLLKVGPAWTVDAMVVFNDPDLYGLRLALGGPKAGGLAGLSIDILYKKITDDIGVFQIEFTFPDAIRNLNFGAVSITLPQIGVKVFTNGDFFIDIGFPYNLDFRRSFSFSAIVYGVPVLGSGGLYFGKLSNATSTKEPVTDKGTFDPVIEFGIGLQLGLGYNFQKGPLSAGFALTVFGIVEGVYAAWHPYDPARALVAREASGGALQSDYYFKLSGTVGVIGLLYGSVDFKIISAAVNVKITLSLQLTYESFREIPIVATATVDVTARVKIDLGLFSITLKFSFSMRVSATFQIGSPEQAPWDPDDRALEALRARSLMTAGPDAAVRRARQLRPRARRLAEDRAFAALDRPTLRLMAGAQFTVAAPSGSVDPADNQGAFVLLLAMDAPDPAAEAAPTLATLAANAGAARAVDADPPSSFELLCTAYFPWLIDNLQGATADSIAAVVTSTVTREELEAYVTKLADVNDPSLNIGDLLTFLGDAFTLDIENPPTAQASGLKAALDAGSVLLPAFDGLTLTAPKASGDGTTTVTFETYATATPGYRALVSQQLTEVAARIEAENQESPRSALGAEEASADSLASTVFVDAFNLIGSQLLQTAEDLLAAFPYRLTSTTQLSDIVSTINGYGSGNDIKPEDVALPNADHPLGGAIGLRVPVPADVLQSTDTLATVAARYTDDAGRYATTPAQLIVANGMQRSLRAGAVLKLQGQSGPETVITRAGDTFQEIADALKITLEALSTQSALYDATDLLAPTTTLLVPPVAYTAAGAAGAASSDTLRSVGALFAVDVPTLADANVDVPGLFAVDADEGIVTVASLQAAPVDVLLQAVIATGEIGQTAALVSRFLTYGLRLPKADGLTLSSDFLYPTDAPDFGLYQLTGQQVPTPTGADSYALGLARVGSSHGVDLGFIGFDNDPSGTGTTIDLSEAYVRLDATATWAQGGNFKPTPTLEALPLATRAPKPFPAASFAFLSSADLGAFLSLTQRGAAAVADADGPQPQPILWHLPPGLLTVTAHRQASIEAATGGFDAALPLLPALQPQRGTSSPATGQTDYADLTHWAWATRVDVQIKRLPAANVEATEGIVDEPLPRGPASQPSLPNTYELVGTNANNTRLLERILVATDALGEDVISGLFLVYNPDGGGAPRLVTPADADFLAFITQTNLSTETNPPAATRLRALAADTAAPRGIANAPGEFIKLLWELSVVRSGGYYLYYEQTESGEGLPASIFDADSTGDLTLLVVYDAQAGQA
ncbi:MAG: peptidoglycan-binding protein, partial [Acidobacteriota bacterium]